ncbi:MAG: hypothetical protein WCY30_08795 [Candidatus Neomarinimicrobiota bacterium]
MRLRRTHPLTFFPILIGYIMFQSLAAQESGIAIKTNIDTTVATIGDRINLLINMRYPGGTIFELPPVDMMLGQLEVVDNRLSEPRKKNKMFEQNWQLTLAVFDTGSFTIPALEIKAFKADDTTSVLTFQTEPRTVRVYSVLAPDSRELKDIKPPFRLRRTISAEVLLLILLIGLTAGAYWYYRHWKKKHPPVIIDEKFLESPHVVALNQLKSLKAKFPTTPEEMRIFYFRISEILREFLERRFFIRALEMTTTEIVAAFDSLDIEPAVVDEWLKLLPELDIVKYAGQTPAEKNIAAVWDQSYRCVDRTKREQFLWRTM